MAVLLTITGSGEYVSSGIERPPVIVAPSCGPSPLGSDPHTAFVESMKAVMHQVEDRLLAWLRNPDAFADDETDAPSRDAIRAAIKFVQQLKVDVSRLAEVPLRAATIGSGGAINLEFARGGVALTGSFKPDGSAEQLIFADGRLRSRAHINFPQG